MVNQIHQFTIEDKFSSGSASINLIAHEACDREAILGQWKNNWKCVLNKETILYPSLKRIYEFIVIGEYEYEELAR